MDKSRFARLAHSLTTTQSQRPGRASLVESLRYISLFSQNPLLIDGVPLRRVSGSPYAFIRAVVSD